MKKVAVIVGLLLGISGSILACGKVNTENKRQSETENTIAETEEIIGTEKAVENTEFYLPTEETDELEKQYRMLIRDIQGKVRNRNMEEMSEYISYPCYIGLEGVISVRNKEEFAKLNADEVFPESLIEAIEQVNPDSLELKDAGYVISAKEGRPSVTIARGDDGRVGITGFNY